MDYVVIRSEFIETLDEARAYYVTRLVGAHKISCCGQLVTIVFEREATHLYSTATKGAAVRSEAAVRRQLPSGAWEDPRAFNPERARLMDHVLRAVSLFVVSTPEAGGRPGFQKRVLYGPAFADGRHLRVVLRPGPGDAWTCVSAYPVSPKEVLDARRLPRRKFPP